MSGGYDVDLEALHNAAEGIARTVGEVSGHDLSHVGGTDLGHEHLADTLSDFCDRWKYGVGQLTKDGRAIAAALGDATTVYRHTDEAARQGSTRRCTSSPVPFRRHVDGKVHAK